MTALLTVMYAGIFVLIVYFGGVFWSARTGRRLPRWWHPAWYLAVLVTAAAVAWLAFAYDAPFLGWIYVGICVLWVLSLVREMQRTRRRRTA